MDNKTIIGYEILAKRAIETESGINIDDALSRITAFRVVRGEGEDHHPSSDVTVSTKILYYTKTDKGYIAWIWVDGEGWVSAGGVSNESWKAWSEEHGSSAANEDSVYIGENLTAEGEFPSYQFGHDNVVDGEVPEFVEPQEIVSMNIGAMNTVHGEGINIGKKNTTDTFGITIGQRNVSHGAGIAIGEDLTVDNGSIGIGKRMRLESGSYAIGSNPTDFRVGYGSHLFGSNNSGLLDNGSYLFGGQNNLQSTYGSIIAGLSNQILYSSAGGISIFGCHNIIGNGDYPSGSVALGNYHDIKGSSSVSLGIAAGSKNCSIAISAKGTNSELGSFADTGSIAIGNRGVYAYYGSASMGTDGVAAHDHSVSIGNGGVHTYNYSFAFGTRVTAHSYSMALGMDGCYAFEQSISVGRSGSTALDRSMVFGRDGVFGFYRGIVVGHTGASAMYHALAIGIENVKGKYNSVAVGRAGVYATEGSVSVGNGGYARAGSMSLLNVPNAGSFSYKTEAWNSLEKLALFLFRSKDGTQGYVDVKLTGVQFNSGTYTVTSTGNQYSETRYLPFNSLGVAIRGHIDEHGNIVPFYIPMTTEMESVTIPDGWVNVSWGDTYNDTVSVDTNVTPDKVGFGAINGSLVMGNGVTLASGGSVAISKRKSTEGYFQYSVSNVANNAISILVRTGTTSDNSYTPISRFSASATNSSIAFGTGVKANDESTVIGLDSYANRGSLAIGYGLWNPGTPVGTAIDDSLLISTVGYPSDGVKTRGSSWGTSIAIGNGPVATSASQSIGICTKAESKSVSIGYYSRSSNESIAIGDDNETGLNAFAIGTKNLSYGWSMLFGVDNKTPRERGAHATLIGYNNTSTSNIEKLEKEYDVWTSEPYVITDADRSTMDGYANTITGIVGQYLGSSAGTTLSNYLSAYKSYYYGNGTAPAYTSEIETIFNSLITNPVFIMTEEDKAAYLDVYYREDPTYTYSWEFVKGAYLDLFEIIKKYDSSATSAYNALRTVSSESDLRGVYYNYPVNSYVNTFYQCATFEGTPTTSAITDASDQAAYNSASMSFTSYGSMLLSKINNPTGHYETVTEDIICNTVVFGEGNTSNHYNSILIGSGNISRAPDEEVANTDDDGFVVALGRKNEVLRNYDIAIGCKSKALGGENVAIQHSTAGDGNASYHNLAMFDSTALGTGNTAIQQSFVDSGYNNIAALQSHVNGGTYNLALFGSQVAGDQNIALMGSKITASTNTEKGDDPFPRAHQNCLFDSTLNQGDLPTDAPWANYEIEKKSSESNLLIDTDINIAAQSFSRNLVIGRNKHEYHDATVNWEVLNFVDNIITGLNSQVEPTLALNYIQNVTHNIWLNCEYDLTGIEVLNSNFAFASELKQVGTTSGSSAYPDMRTKYLGNFIFRSKTEGTGAEINDNVLFYDSVLRTNTPNVGDHATLAGNFLMHSELSYDSSDVDKVPVFNFQYNSDFVNTQQSFSFSTNTVPREEYYLANAYGPANLMYCNQSWNFGGNHLDFCTQSLMVGADSAMSNCNRCYTFGAKNNMFMPVTDADGWHALHNDLIVGETNRLLYDFNTNDDSSNRLYGTDNLLSVHGGGFAFNNLIDGTENTIEIFNARVGANTIRGERNRMYLTFNEASSSGDRDVNKENVLLGSSNLISADSRIGRVVLTENQVANGIVVDCPKFVPATTFSWYVYKGPKMSISNNGYYLYVRRLGTIVSTRLPSGATIVAALVPGDLVDGVNNGTLVDNGYYKATGDLANIELPNISYEALDADYLYSLQNGVAYLGEKSDPHESNQPAHLVDHNLLVGSYNLVHSNTVYYTLLGCFNEVRCTDIPYPSFAYGHGFVCGNNNQVENGSNILCFGNGNYSTGFNSVAIGMNLKSNKWQTVIGKYNVPIEGPNRLDIENPQDPNAALFIIGNGFSEKDDDDWQDEQYITRSNAMVVYADGTVRAKKFVSDEPELELIKGTGIEMTDDITAGTRTISVSQEIQDLLTFLSSRPATGTYTINSTDGVLTWEPIGITQV